MLVSEQDKKIICNEIDFKTFVISGPGGQNLQKTSSGAEAHWELADSKISELLKNKITSYLIKNKSSLKLQFRSQIHRSLDLNKKECLKKVFEFITKALFVPKKRIATKPSYSSKQKKINSKKRQGEIKKNRQKVTY